MTTIQEALHNLNKKSINESLKSNKINEKLTQDWKVLLQKICPISTLKNCKAILYITYEIWGDSITLGYSKKLNEFVTYNENEGLNRLGSDITYDRIFDIIDVQDSTVSLPGKDGWATDTDANILINLIDYEDLADRSDDELAESCKCNESTELDFDRAQRKFRIRSFEEMQDLINEWNAHWPALRSKVFYDKYVADGNVFMFDPFNKTLELQDKDGNIIEGPFDLNDVKVANKKVVNNQEKDFDRTQRKFKIRNFEEMQELIKEWNAQWPALKSRQYYDNYTKDGHYFMFDPYTRRLELQDKDGKVIQRVDLKDRKIAEAKKSTVDELNLNMINTFLKKLPQVTDSRVAKNFNWSDDPNKKPEAQIIFGLKVDKNDKKGEENYIYSDGKKLALEGPNGYKVFKNLDELKTIIDKYYPEDKTIKESCKKCNEDFESSKPVTLLSPDQVRNFIVDVKPGKFFNVGYIKELGPEISSKFKKGVNEPIVRIIKCTEMYGSTGTDYEEKQATKDMRTTTGKERSGNAYHVDVEVANKILKTAGGNELLQFYPRSTSKPKVKYFISVDDADLTPATKDQIAPYLTNSALDKLNSNQESEGAAVVRLNLNKIYMIGNLGNSIM